MKPDHDWERRVARLERSGRRTRWGCALVLLVGLAAGSVFSEGEKTVRAERFELVDPQGRVRATLELRDGGPGLFLSDEQGRLRASVSHDDSQTALYLRDAEGQIRVGAAQFAHGGGGYALHGPEGKGAAVLYLKGKGSLRFFDEQGTELAHFPE